MNVENTQHRSFISENERALISRDEAVSFRQANATPALMSIVRAEGIWIEDASGNRYRDFYGKNKLSPCGYRHPRVIAAVQSQLERLCFV